MTPCEELEADSTRPLKKTDMYSMYFIRSIYSSAAIFLDGWLTM